MPEYANLHGPGNAIEKYHRLFGSCLRNVLMSLLTAAANGRRQQLCGASLVAGPARVPPSHPGSGPGTARCSLQFGAWAILFQKLLGGKAGYFSP